MTERVIQRSGVHARRAGNWALNVVLAVLGILMLAPFYWVFITSLLTTKDAFQLPPVWFPSEITVVNYRRVFELIPFWHMALNSLKISGIITLGSVTTSVLAAYAFARLRFPGRDVLFIILLSALMVPVQVTVIPTFILIRHLHLLDTHEAVYLPALINVFGVFLLRQFFLGIPSELEDAARIDGAGPHGASSPGSSCRCRSRCSRRWRSSRCRSAWNEFFWTNLFLTSADRMTLPVGIVSLQGQYGGGSSFAIFAAASMIVFPTLILFTFTQRFLTESIARTGIKG